MINDVRYTLLSAMEDIIKRNATYKVIVVAVQHPDGSVETITNHGDAVPDKVSYYLDNYDNEMCLKRNTDIRIVGVMLV